MSKVKPKHPPVGTRVAVLDAKQEKDLGNGTIEGYKWVRQGPFKLWTPTIKLDGGRIICGFECWWKEIRT